RRGDAARRPNRARRESDGGTRARERDAHPPGDDRPRASRGRRRRPQGLDGDRHDRGLPARLRRGGPLGAGMIDLKRVDDLVADEYRFFADARAGWSIAAGPKDLELVAHALRVVLHTRTLGDFRDEYRALVTCQHADGGWAPKSDDAESTVWVSAFCALMLIR